MFKTDDIRLMLPQSFKEELSKEVLEYMVNYTVTIDPDLQAYYRKVISDNLRLDQLTKLYKLIISYRHYTLKQPFNNMFSISFTKILLDDLLRDGSNDSDNDSDDLPFTITEDLMDAEKIKATFYRKLKFDIEIYANYDIVFVDDKFIDLLYTWHIINLEGGAVENTREKNINYVIGKQYKILVETMYKEMLEDISTTKNIEDIYEMRDDKYNRSLFDIHETMNKTLLS